MLKSVTVGMFAARLFWANIRAETAPSALSIVTRRNFFMLESPSFMLFLFSQDTKSCES